jgi:uncharacterized ion transporter superfamily protein YfcC
MAEGSVNYLGAFAVTFEEIGADLRMATFHIVVGGFADIVQQTGAAGEDSIHSQLFGHRARYE